MFLCSLGAAISFCSIAHLSAVTSLVLHESIYAQVSSCTSLALYLQIGRGNNSLEGDVGTTKKQALFILSSTCNVIITPLFHYAACNDMSTHL